MKKNPGKKTRRTKMVDNNRVAKTWLIKNGYQHIWLKPHTRFLDWVWESVKENNQIVKYQARDLWNIFDGVCWKNGWITFLAISDRFKGVKQLEEFINDKYGFNVLMIKVKKEDQSVHLMAWTKTGVAFLK